MRTTLQDVARYANVHHSTVAHVLNGSRGNTRVSPETRQRVLDAAAALGYSANRAAQQLRSGRGHVVGLLVGPLENPFFARMVSLCGEELERHGYDMVLAVRRNDEVQDLHLLEGLLSRQLDGLLLWSETITETRERVQQPDMDRTVVLGYEIPGRDSVAAELTGGVRAALEHLFAQGCRRIGYLAPRVTLTRRGNPRHDLYCDIMSSRGEPLRIYSYDGSAADIGAAARGAMDLASGPERPDGLLCFNDMVAVGALMGLRRCGVSVPGEVALVGCDDLPLAAEMDVPLSTIDYPLASMCRIAVDMLIERMRCCDDDEPFASRHRLLPTALRVRASSLRYGAREGVAGGLP